MTHLWEGENKNLCLSVVEASEIEIYGFYI